MRFRNFHAGCCGYVPTRSDGSEWGHVLTLGDGSTVYADTAEEVLGELIEGWEAAAAAERADLLVRHAVEQAGEAQRRHLLEATTRGVLDPTDPDDQTLLPVLEADKRASLLLQTPEMPGEQAEWLAPVALVLLTTSYQPHGEHPPIGGRTVWLDPTGAEPYLLSLSAAGLHDYWRLADSL